MAGNKKDALVFVAQHSSAVRHRVSLVTNTDSLLRWKCQENGCNGMYIWTNLTGQTIVREEHLLSAQVELNQLQVNKITLVMKADDPV
jgi:hypothetical protein